MILVIGGAYQGKADFVKRRFSLSEDDFLRADRYTERLSTEKRVIYGLEEWVYGRVSAGKDTELDIRGELCGIKNKIIICNDITQGLVPMDKTDRAWREAVGRCITFLAANADEVYRVFCGIENRIK